MIAETPEEWSVRTWRERHDVGYFPRSEQHRDWKVFDAMPDWFMKVAQPKPDDVALEIGCGYGEWMIPLAQHVGEIHGIDIHQAPIEKAREYFKERLLNCYATLSDGRTIPFSKESFSLVYSISVFQHLPRSIVHGYLRESLRALRPGGRVVHHFRNADNIGPYPTPATDLGPGNVKEFSVGWTADQVTKAAEDACLSAAAVHDIGLFLILTARKT